MDQDAELVSPAFECAASPILCVEHQLKTNSSLGDEESSAAAIDVWSTQQAH